MRLHFCFRTLSLCASFLICSLYQQSVGAANIKVGKKAQPDQSTMKVDISQVHSVKSRERDQGFVKKVLRKLIDKFLAKEDSEQKLLEIESDHKKQEEKARQLKEKQKMARFEELFASEKKRYRKQLYFDRQNYLKVGFVEKEIFEVEIEKEEPRTRYFYHRKGWAHASSFNFDVRKRYAKATRQVKIFHTRSGKPVVTLPKETPFLLLGKMDDYLLVGY